ncbi:hypothetical protein Tco_0502590 [Tanacetum coccineum]
MAESSSQVPSSPPIIPKEEPVTQDRPESPNHFLPADKVNFNFDEMLFTTNNEVALVYPDHPKSEYFQLVSDFISKCCLRKAFTSAPTQYVEYLAEFWVNVDFAKIIWEDLIHKLNKKSRERVISYPRFISILLEYMAPEYDNESLTINLTQVFSVNNWALKPNQPEGPPFTEHMLVVSSYIFHSESTSGNDASADFTAKVDPKISAPNDSVPHQQGPDKGSKNYTPDHTFVGNNPSVLVDKTKFAGEGSQTANTVSDTKVDTRSAFMDDEDESFIASEESSEEHAKRNEDSCKSTASLAEGEKNTNPVTKDAELANLVDLIGINVVEEYHKKKLLYNKYCDKMLKRKKSPKITNCEVLTKKGPITLKIYREDGSEEVISNIKVSDLYLAEWREVTQACPEKSEKGWKTIYALVKTRLDQLTQTEQELKIDINKPLKEQDSLNELNELSNKKSEEY